MVLASGAPCPCGGDVADAEVGHHRQSGAFGDPRRVAQLQRAARGAVFDPVEHRLTQRGDDVRLATGQFLDATHGRLGEGLAHQGVEFRELFGVAGIRREGGEQGIAERFGIRDFELAERREHHRVPVGAQFGGRHVDPVDRRAGDEPDHPDPSAGENRHSEWFIRRSGERASRTVSSCPK